MGERERENAERVLSEIGGVRRPQHGEAEGKEYLVR